MNTRLISLLLLIFVDSFCYFVVIPILLNLYYNDSVGLLPHDTSYSVRNILTGFTIGLSTLAALISAPLIGSLSDKLGRKKVLMVSVFAINVGFLLPIMGILEKNIFLILLGRFISGVGSASQPVAQAAVADISEGKRRSLNLNLIALMMTLPIILGPLAGGYLSDSHLIRWFNLTTPYWCAFILSFLSLLLILFFFEETKLKKETLIDSNEMSLGAFKIIKQYRLSKLMLIFFCIELAWSQYYQSIILFLNQQFHYSSQKASLFNAYLGIGMSLGLLFLYPLLLRAFSLFQILITSCSFVFLGYLGCLIFPSSLIHWVCGPVIAVFTGCAYVSLVSLVTQRAPMTRQGWAMGTLSTILFSAWIITAFESGFLISLKSTLPFIVSFVAVLIAVMALLFG